MRLDYFIRAWIVGHRVARLDLVMAFLSTIGRGGVVWLVATAALLLLKRISAANALRVVLAILVAILVADYTLKPLVRRERPYVRFLEVPVIGRVPASTSFPSGHTADAFAGAYTLSAIAPAGRIGWWALAATIAYSRIYLGVHYPLDVLGGLVVGVLCGALALRFPRSISSARRAKP